MSRAVFIGGFGNGEASARGVADALQTVGNYEDVDNFSFGQSRSGDYDKLVTDIERAAQGVDVFALSASALGVPRLRAKEATLIDAPLPTSRMHLIANTVAKSVKMPFANTEHGRLDHLARIGSYLGSSTVELFRRPTKNLRPYFNGEISRFDAITAATQLKNMGVLTRLIAMSEDRYFQLASPANLARASAVGVDVTVVEGIHDQLALYPEETLTKILR